MQDSSEESRQVYFIGLINNETFLTVLISNLAAGTRGFGSRFVDELNKSGHGVFSKIRLVAQNYADEGSVSVANNSPKVQQFSQQLIFAL